MDELLTWLKSDQALGWVQLAGLVLARLLPLLAFSPALGGELLPARLRVALAAALGATFFCALEPTFGAVGTERWFLLALKEALIGFGLALAVQLCFQVLSAVGALFDLARGATLANLLDPLSQAQTPVLGVFLLHAFLALYFAVGGQRVVLDALARSYEAYPLGALLPVAAVGPAAAERWIALLSELFVFSLSLAAPAFALLALLDLALGLAQRFAGRLNVFALGMAVKAWLGAGLLALTVGVVLSDALDGLFETLRVFPLGP